MPTPHALALGLSLALPVPAAAAQESQARTAPAPHCLDAREITGMYQGDDASVVVASAQRFYRLQFVGRCPGIAAEASPLLVAPAGWACGGPNESVQGESLRCPVSAVEEIDSREYARHARRAAGHDRNTLAPVTVTASSGTDRSRRYARGFAGTADYCFNPTHMRSWNETPYGLQVQVSPSRNAGNRVYAIELAGSCPMLTSSPPLQFQSGMDVGVICGNPGDRVVAVQETLDPGGNLLGRTARPGGILTGDAWCTVAAVYPVN